MKKLLKFVALSISLLIIIIIISCRPSDHNKKIVLRVYHEKIDCQGYEGINKCYKIQREEKIGSDDWEILYEPITDFNYVEGYQYDIKVKIKYLLHPAIDQPSPKYICLEVYSSEKIN